METTSPEPSLEEWDSPEDLPPLDAFVAGQTQYRPPITDELAGRVINASSETGPDVSLRFLTGSQLERVIGEESDYVDYEATRVRDGIYLVNFLDAGWRVEDAVPGKPVSVTWAVDFTTQRATVALSYVIAVSHAGQGALLRAATSHHSYNWDGSTGSHPRSSGLVGLRIMWRYSETDHYDHVYMNRSNFAWQCVRGVERGMTELDRCRAYEVADDLYFFHWSESQFVVESALFIDVASVRTYGRFFGLDARDASILHHQFGAYGVVLNQTVFPTEPGVDPTVWQSSIHRNEAEGMSS